MSNGSKSELVYSNWLTVLKLPKKCRLLAVLLNVLSLAIDTSPISKKCTGTQKKCIVDDVVEAHTMHGAELVCMGAWRAKHVALIESKLLWMFQPRRFSVSHKPSCLPCLANNCCVICSPRSHPKLHCRGHHCLKFGPLFCPYVQPLLEVAYHCRWEFCCVFWIVTSH